MLAAFIRAYVGAAIILLAQYSVARAENADAVLHRMFSFFDAAEARSGLDQQLVTSLRDKVRLTRELTSRNKTMVQPEYIKSLSSDAALLEAALKETNSTAANQTIAFVRDDLALKITFETSISGSKDAFRGKVQVNVATRRNGVDVSDLIVGANPKLWQDQQELMFPLGASSPAHGSLPPGLYRIFIKKPSGSTVVAQDSAVGLTGADSEDIIVVLPDGQ